MLSAKEAVIDDQGLREEITKQTRHLFTLGLKEVC